MMIVEFKNYIVIYLWIVIFANSKRIDLNLN